MKRLYVAPLLALGFFALSRQARPQKYVPPNYNHCISTSVRYGDIWVSNSCNLRLSVTFVANDQSFHGETDVNAGRESMLGWTQDDRRRAGGIEYYVCPAGYIPVDGSDEPVEGPGEQFHCKQI
jgi:hypothetical protein